MGPGEVLGLLIVVLIPTVFLSYMARRFFTFREKQLDAQTSLAAEKAAQYAANNAELEARLRVLEQEQDQPIRAERAIDAFDRDGAVHRERLQRERKGDGAAEWKDRKFGWKSRLRRFGH